MLSKSKIDLRKREASVDKLVMFKKSQETKRTKSWRTFEKCNPLPLSYNKLLLIIKTHEEENKRLQEEIIQQKKEQNTLETKKKELLFQNHMLKRISDKLSTELAILQRNTSSGYINHIEYKTTYGKKF